MVDLKRRKIESIVFAFMLSAVCLLLALDGALEDVWKNVVMTLPVFLAALFVFSFNIFWIRLCAFALLWIPQVILLKTGDCTVLFFPVVSLVFAASCFSTELFQKKQATLSIIIAACVPFLCVIHNLSRESLINPFNPWWIKMIVYLVLLGVFFLYLCLLNIKTNNHQSDQRFIVKASKAIFAIAVVDLAIGIETMIQFTWSVFNIPFIYGAVWLLFLTAIFRYNLPQIDQLKKRLNPA